MKMKNSNELQVVSIRLVDEPPWIGKDSLNSPEKVANFLGEELSKYDREVFCILNMSTKNQVINMNIVSVGTLNGALISPRELFKSAILSNSAQIILVHNHPSGVAIPSREDILITQRLSACGDLLGIPVIDHIITGGKGELYSMRKENTFPTTKAESIVGNVNLSEEMEASIKI